MKRSLNKLYKEIEKELPGDNSLNLDKIGEVSYFNYSKEILAWNPPGAKVLIVAGIHGNEPAGVMMLPGLLKKFKLFNFSIIFCVNPWGYENNFRENQKNKEINRDFRQLATQEARIVDNFLQDKSYELVLDLHEDPDEDTQGFYLFDQCSKNVYRKKAKKLIKQVKKRGIPIERKMRVFPMKIKAGVIKVPDWASWITKLLNRLAFSNYCKTEKISQNVLVIETPAFLSIEKRIELQFLAVKCLADDYLR